jgi:ferredoxin
MKVKIYPLEYAGKKLPYGKAAVVGDLVFLSGLSGIDPDTNQIPVDGVETQTLVALRKIKRYLEDVGVIVREHCVHAYIRAAEIYRRDKKTVKEFIGNALKSYGEPVGPLASINTYPEKEPSPYVPHIDIDKCTFCETCAERCFYDVIEVDKMNHVVNIHPDQCWSCGLCVSWCPSKAISLVNPTTNEVVWDGIGQAKPLRPRR